MVRTAVVASFLMVMGSGADAQDLVLTNATILDPASRTVVRASLGIAGGAIAWVGADVPAAAAGERIDLKGRFVIPGLVDLHTHSFGHMLPGGGVEQVGTASVVRRVLRAGVTAFLDLFSPEETIFALREQQRAGAFGGAEIFAAGPALTATNGHGTEFGIPTRLINSPEDARREIAGLAPKRPDVIKIIYGHRPGGPPSLDRATLTEAVAAARERHIKTIVHVEVWEDVRHAAAAGATAVTHVPRDGIVPDDVVALLATRGTISVPTLTLDTDILAFHDTPALLRSPLMAALGFDAARDAYRKDVALPPEQVARARVNATTAIASARKLHEGGVPILVGTDAGELGAVHGYSVHRELIHLVDAGLTPWEALAAATTRSGDFLGRHYGVRVGDAANLVVLDASPLDDIQNTQRISTVILRGRVVLNN
jgi:imidazolonepropionase-like amidohydrolase